MNRDAVAELYRALEEAGVDIWIDGGWAVDALAGRETRPHSDLDVAVEARNLVALRRVLTDRGYRDTPTPDETIWNFVVADPAGHRVDVHVVELDDSLGVLAEPRAGIAYPAGALTGVGRLGTTTVRCIRADILLRFKTSYPPRPKDRHDVAVLCALLGEAVPEPYRRDDKP